MDAVKKMKQRKYAFSLDRSMTEKDVAMSGECFVTNYLIKSIYSRIVASSVTDRNRRIGSTCRNNYGFLLESARSIFLSMPSRKFIHYTGPAVPNGTGSDSWTANPIEDGCAPQRQIKSYFIPLPAKILSLSLSHSPSFSRPLSAA